MTRPPVRVAVTGLSAVTALGASVEETFARLAAGDRGFSEVTEFDASCCKIRIAAEIKNFRVADVAPAGKAGLYSRADALALCAAEAALTRAGLADHELGLTVGGTSGGMREAESILMTRSGRAQNAADAQRLIAYPPESTTRRLCEVFPSIRRAATFCSACSSSATAIIQAASWVASGACECVLAGGTDSLCLLTLTGFASLGAMSAEPCRPFDQRRTGMSLGEGAAFLVLESEAHARARGAETLAWLDGSSLGAEAHHITHPEPSGARSAQLMTRALRQADVHTSEVGYYNAHGTGTIPNDSMEASALGIAFGVDCSSVRVSTAKGQLGHTLGAAGAVEAAITVLALREGILPPTGGLEQPADDARLNHVMGSARRDNCQYAISGSFGFGGLGAVLLFSRADTEARSSVSTRRAAVITGLAQSPSSADPLASLDPERSRRFDRITALACGGGLGDVTSDAGLLVCNAYGNVGRLTTYLQRLGAKGIRGIAPAEFPHLVPSAIAGNTSIYLSLKGPVTNTSDDALGFANALAFASDLVEQGLATSMLVGAVESADSAARVIADPFELLGSTADRDVSIWLGLEDERVARERGAQALARVTSIRVGLAKWSQALRESEAPTLVDRSRLVLAGVDGAAVDRAVDVGRWREVLRIIVASDCSGLPGQLEHDALAAALSSISRNEAEDILLLAMRGPGYFAMRLAAPGRS